MRYGFNLKHKELIDTIESQELYQYNLLKNKALITGDGNVVRYFFQKAASTIVGGGLAEYIMAGVHRMFIYNTRKKNAFVFYGVTKMLNRAMIRLVTTGYFTLEGAHTDRLSPILDNNNFPKLWQDAIRQESGIGDVLLRVVKDNEIADYPIIEVIEAENYELITKRGHIIGYLMKSRIELEKNHYEMHEIYQKDDGVVCIEYKFWDVKANGYLERKNKTDLYKKLIEAFGLEELDKRKEFPKMLLPGLKRIPIVYKSNTETNKGLRGIADTEGMETIEDALSEVLSDMVDEVRKGGIKLMIDRRLIPITQGGEKMEYDEFDKTFIVTEQEGADGGKLFQTAQGVINSEKYIEQSKFLLASAFNKIGLHPLTGGVTGLESIVASAESQQEREGKSSLRRRDEKHLEWNPKLVELMLVLLEMDDYIRNDGDSIGEYEAKEIELAFGEYVNPHPEAIYEIINKKLEMGITSMKREMKKNNPKINDEVIDLIYAQVKSEKGLALTPKELELLGGVQAEPPEAVDEE